MELFQLSVVQRQAPTAIPTYPRIFKRPPLRFRPGEDIDGYGREYLKGWYVPEWKKYLQNQIVVKKWLQEAQQSDPKHEDETKRQWLTRIVIPREAEGKSSNLT